MSKKPIWYLAGPFYRYAQDVKALAAKAGVRIVDANVTESRKDAAPEKDLPKVDLLPEYGGAEKKKETAAEKKAREKAEKDAQELADAAKAAAALTGQPEQ